MTNDTNPHCTMGSHYKTMIMINSSLGQIIIYHFLCFCLLSQQMFTTPWLQMHSKPHQTHYLWPLWLWSSECVFRLLQNTAFLYYLMVFVSNINVKLHVPKYSIVAQWHDANKDMLAGINNWKESYNSHSHQWKEPY